MSGARLPPQSLPNRALVVRCRSISEPTDGNAMDRTLLGVVTFRPHTKSPRRDPDHIGERRIPGRDGGRG